jgi:hypothetical protein
MGLQNLVEVPAIGDSDKDGLDPAAPRHGCDLIAATPVWYIPRHSIATRGAVTEEFYRIVAGFAGERQQRQLEGAAP